MRSGGCDWSRHVMQLPDPEPRDRELIELLRARDGRMTTVVLKDGRRCLVRDIVWGYDAGDEYAHATTNVSPGAPGLDVDFFSTTEIQHVLGEDGTVLLAVDYPA